MQKTGNPGIKTAHRTVQSSTTLNRKYVKKPELTSRQKQFEQDYLRRQEITERINRENSLSRLKTLRKTTTTTTAATTTSIIQSKTETPEQISAKALKERAIKNALASAEKIQPEPKATIKTHKKVSFPRIAFAVACVVIVLFGVGYLIKINIPNFSLRVAALQTGIEASYPAYVPSAYHLSEITSSDGQINIKFVNNTNDSYFEIYEEKSSWDSAALLNNYVKQHMANNYSTIRERGLTIYADATNAAWVDGGIVYKIVTSSNALTEKQLKDIAIRFYSK